MRPFLLLAALAALLSSTSSLAQGPAKEQPVAPAAQGAAAPEVPDSSSTTPQLTRADVEAWLDGFMPQTLRSSDIAGAVVVVVKDGQTLLQKGYGYADVAKKLPVDPARTLFRPGSVSKLFTWTAVMQQVEQGKLDLDADVNQYIDFKIPDREGKPVSLRNIMTHTAGFEEQAKGIMSLEEKGVPALDAHLKAWVPTRIFAPGTTPAYSNYATALAGYIVARVSGMSFDDYLDKNLFAPLQMNHSTFRQPLPERLKPDMSKGYPRASEDEKPYEIVGPAPAGSLAAPGADMANFMIAHLQNGTLGDQQILKPETAKLMHDTALTLLPRVKRMVLGFYEANLNGHRIIAHGGDTQWFHSDLNLFLDDGIGLYISMNSTGKEGAAGDVRSALLERFADRYLPGDIPGGEVDEKTAAEHARMAVGQYEVSRRMQTSFLSLLSFVGPTKIALDAKGNLSVPAATDAAGVPLKWKEIEPFLWRAEGTQQLLAAQVENNRVTRFTFDPVSAIMVWEPMPGYRASAWLLPLFGVGMVMIALTLLAWPVTALIRRHYRASYPLAGQDAKGHRYVRYAALAVVALWLAWGISLTKMLADFNLLTADTDWWFWILQLLSLVIFFAAAAAGVWNALIVLRSQRSWYAKVWGVLLGVGFLAVLWVALMYKQIAFDVNY